MKNLIKSLVVFTLLLSSCKSPIEKNGPQICPSSNFKFTSNQFIINSLVYNSSTKSFDKTQVSNGANIDFSEGGINLYADLGEEIGWEITLNSKTSSASYKFSGNSSVVDVNWFGQTKNLPFFGAEGVDLVFTIACKDPINLNFNISQRPTFKHVSKDFGLLLRDWDKNGYYPVSGNTPQNGADGWLGDANITFSYDSTPEAYSGAGKHVKLYRQSTNKLWYFGATSFPLPGIDTLLSTNNPDSLYINAFIKADYDNTGIEFGLQSASVNYMKTGAIDWNGWKVISVKLSDLIVTSGSQAGSKFTNLATNDISFIISLGANPVQATELNVSYDFVFMSVGKPLFE